MANQVKRTISISPESDHEIHQLATAWGIPVSKARERCYHYAARGLEVGVTNETIEKIANIRQAEVKVELLKAN